MKKISAVLVGFLLISTSALSTPILDYKGGSSVVGILDFEVNGILYDVSWQQGSYNGIFDTNGVTPTFLNDSSGAQSAANGLITLFEANNLFPSDISGLCSNNSSDCDFVIPWSVSATNIDAFNIDWAQPSGPWNLQPQNWTRDFDHNLVAMTLFTQSAAVPEPASLALLILGLAGIGFSRKKRAV